MIGQQKDVVAALAERGNGDGTAAMRKYRSSRNALVATASWKILIRRCEDANIDVDELPFRRLARSFALPARAKALPGC